MIKKILTIVIILLNVSLSGCSNGLYNKLPTTIISLGKAACRH